VAAANKPLEESADEAPGKDVDRRSGRHDAHAREEYGNVNVFEERLRIASGKVVEGDGCDCADEEAVNYWVVKLASGEGSRGADATEEERGGREYG